MSPSYGDDPVVEDILGYTTRTGMLLHGMGAEELIPQCRRLNISTDLLVTLSEDDFQLLGASSELAARMLTELRSVTQRLDICFLTERERFDQLLDILSNGNKHLSLIQAYITYIKIRLKKKCDESYMDTNQFLLSSRAFYMALNATLDEIKDTQSALRELETVNNNRRKHVVLRFGILCGIGFFGYALLRKYN